MASESDVVADALLPLIHSGVIDKSRTPEVLRLLHLDQAHLLGALDRYQRRGERYRFPAHGPIGTDVEPVAPNTGTRPKKPKGDLPVRPSPPPDARGMARQRILTATFPLSDGRIVELLAATAADHRQRAEWLKGHALSMLTVASIHEEAAAVIEATPGAQCLADVPEHDLVALNAVVEA